MLLREGVTYVDLAVLTTTYSSRRGDDLDRVAGDDLTHLVQGCLCCRYCLSRVHHLLCGGQECALRRLLHFLLPGITFKHTQFEAIEDKINVTQNFRAMPKKWSCILTFITKSQGKEISARTIEL